DLNQWQAYVVMQYKDRALFDRQASERPVERVTVDNADEGVGSRRPVDRQDPHVCCPCPATPGLGVAGMDEQAPDPGLEAVRVAECRKLAPGGEEGTLQGVLR